MKKKKYLPLVHRWTERGMPAYGLCTSLPKDHFLQLFEPSEEDINVLSSENKSTMYWGSDSEYWRQYDLTPLRQNILLLMAAMNNEL